MSHSLREIAERMDPDQPDRRLSARRLFGNGPPFVPSRPKPYDINKLEFDLVKVDEDTGSLNPPKTRVVKGPVNLKAIEEKVIYNGIRYLDAPKGSAPEGTIVLLDTEANSPQEVYLQNLFFSDLNAYDLGMINRTDDNNTLPNDYTEKGIIESHRWVDSTEGRDQSEAWRSIRNVVDRHQKGVWHRVLFQNVNLIDSRSIGENITDIAKEFGKRFGTFGFDIVGMCEVPREKLIKKHIQPGYGESYNDIDRRWAKKDLGVLVGGRRQSDNITVRNIVDMDSNQFLISGGSSGTIVSREGWLRVVIEVPTLPGNPKFEIFITHLQPVRKDHYEDQKQSAKIAQMVKLREEIEERIDEKPEWPKIVMGDFNIHSSGRGKAFGADSGIEKGEYFSNFMYQMYSVGMQNIWLTYGGPGEPNNECENKENNYLCNPFLPNEEKYYQGNYIDYAFIEKPQPEHELQIDITRTKATGWPKKGGGYLTDHPGIAFDILTSPKD